MRRIILAILAACAVLLFAQACDVPKPPPEVATATPGSQNPENDQSRLGRTPVRLEQQHGFTPVATGPGRIYFVREGHLWVVLPDGSGARQLSGLSVTNAPQPSPDGSLVAFTSGRDLYVIPAQGGTPRLLASGDMAEKQRLGWTHDGKLVGYMVYDPLVVGSEQAFAAAVTSERGPVSITSMAGAVANRGATYERSVQWSPDDNWVVVSTIKNPLKLLRWPRGQVLPNDETEIAGGEPDWSPDSRTLMYTETLGGAVLIYGIEDARATPFRNEKEFVGTGLGEYADGPGPRWSPASQGSDSDLIAYRSHTAQGEPRIALRRRDGSALQPLPPLTNGPSWSPSGDTIAVETGTLAIDSLGPKWKPDGIAICKVNFNGPQTARHIVANAHWPVWGK